MGPLSRRLSILVYHRVISEPDPLVPDQVCAREFDWQLAVLGRWFTVLPLREAAVRLRGGTLPVRAACATPQAVVTAASNPDSLTMPTCSRR